MCPEMSGSRQLFNSVCCMSKDEVSPTYPLGEKKHVMQANTEVTMTAKVMSVGDLKTAKTGTKYRILHIADETGSLDLKLWNNDAETKCGLSEGHTILAQNLKVSVYHNIRSVIKSFKTTITKVDEVCNATLSPEQTSSRSAIECSIKAVKEFSFYNSCPTCNKKVISHDDNKCFGKCDSCNSYYNKSMLGSTCRLALQSEHDESLLAFGQQALQICAVTNVTEVKDNMEEVMQTIFSTRYRLAVNRRNNQTIISDVTTLDV
ncbi:hypothetical protein BSL78_21579 [Apostichopus japonicus]|uniref:Replication factor A C-terminal domain-containing protein n=1 Tax=Stichopus japonicus TaxID=307972 RepID=A0A2G8K0R8_STIJA|nr:hypothetical protein BSL78_21579 [Apostichopus japonicus]